MHYDICTVFHGQLNLSLILEPPTNHGQSLIVDFPLPLSPCPSPIPLSYSTSSDNPRIPSSALQYPLSLIISPFHNHYLTFSLSIHLSTYMPHAYPFVPPFTCKYIPLSPCRHSRTVYGSGRTHSYHKQITIRLSNGHRRLSVINCLF